MLSIQQVLFHKSQLHSGKKFSGKKKKNEETNNKFKLGTGLRSFIGACNQTHF